MTLILTLRGTNDGIYTFWLTPFELVRALWNLRLASSLKR